MRYASELAALGVLAAIGGWYAQAPRAPAARAQYLCAPLAAAVHAAGHIEAALDDAGQVIPPAHAWLPDLPRGCERVLQLWAEEEPRDHQERSAR